LDKKEELNHLQEKVMPKGISRNSRTDKRRVKNRISKVKPSKAEPNFVEVGPPMTFKQAMKSVRDLRRSRKLAVKEDSDFRELTAKEDADFRDDTTTNFIEAKQLNYHLGMVVLCIACDDLKKAMWYLNREIENRSKT